MLTMATKQQLGTICSLFFGPTMYQAVGLWSVHYCTKVDLEPNTSRTYMGLCTVHVTPYPHSQKHIKTSVHCGKEMPWLCRGSHSMESFCEESSATKSEVESGKCLTSEEKS